VTVAGSINFGFLGTRESKSPSLSGKMSEFHAAGHASLDAWETKASPKTASSIATGMVTAYTRISILPRRRGIRCPGPPTSRHRLIGLPTAVDLSREAMKRIVVAICQGRCEQKAEEHIQSRLHKSLKRFIAADIYLARRQ
jgi:hypothetical protein